MDDKTITDILHIHPSAHFFKLLEFLSFSLQWYSSLPLALSDFLYIYGFTIPLYAKEGFFSLIFISSFKEDYSSTHQPIGPIVSALVFPRFASLSSSSIAFLVGKRKKFER